MHYREARLFSRSMFSFSRRIICFALLSLTTGCRTIGGIEEPHKVTGHVTCDTQEEVTVSGAKAVTVRAACGGGKILRYEVQTSGFNNRSGKVCLTLSAGGSRKSLIMSAPTTGSRSFRADLNASSATLDAEVVDSAENCATGGR